jgi:hypothetical protein
MYPVVLVRRIDFIRKAPITPRVDVRIVRSLLGGYWLNSTSLDGEYDNRDEYPITPWFLAFENLDAVVGCDRPQALPFLRPLG